MKKFITLMVAVVLSMGVATADNPKKKNVQTQTFTTDIVCQSCEKKIMNNVATLGKGVKDVKVDVASKEVTVTYDASKTSPEKLIKGFSKLNVQAQVKAENAAAGAAKGCCGKCKDAAAGKQECAEEAPTGAAPACRKMEAGAATKPACGDCKKAEGTAQKSCCKEKKAEGCGDCKKAEGTAQKACCKEKKAESCGDCKSKAQSGSCGDCKKAEGTAQKSCCKEKKAEGCGDCKKADAKAEKSCCKEKK